MEFDVYDIISIEDTDYNLEIVRKIFNRMPDLIYRYYFDVNNKICGPRLYIITPDRMYLTDILLYEGVLSITEKTGIEI